MKFDVDLIEPPHTLETPDLFERCNELGEPVYESRDDPNTLRQRFGDRMFDVISMIDLEDDYPETGAHHYDGSFFLPNPGSVALTRYLHELNEGYVSPRLRTHADYVQYFESFPPSRFASSF